MADILNVLKAEHNVLRELFKELDATTDRAVKRRQTLCRKSSATCCLTRMGGDRVLPAFADRASHEGLKTHAEAVEEHRVVKKMHWLRL
jgi:hypothetical protein